MAWSILKGMNLPRVVASAEIDAATGQVVQSENCQIDGVKVEANGGLTFQQKDNALPFFPERASAILEWAPIMEELNDYHLKVSGLKAGQYEVRLGGKKIAELSAEALAGGINLAPEVLREGPIAEQVAAVSGAISAKNAYFSEKIFAGLTLAKIPDFLNLTPEEIEPKRAAAFKERMKTDLPKYFLAIRKALVMRPHQVEIVPVGK